MLHVKEVCAHLLIVLPRQLMLFDLGCACVALLTVSISIAADIFPEGNENAISRTK